MAIELWIQDGNPVCASQSIRVRGTQNAADPVIDPVQSTAQKVFNNYVFVEVENRGTDDAVGCACNKTGAFVAAQVVPPAGGTSVGTAPYFSQLSGASPSGTSYVRASRNSQSNEIYVSLGTGPTGPSFWQSSILPGQSGGWGFSPGGRFFLFAASSGTGGIYVSVILAEGTGKGAIRLSLSLPSGGSPAGWGFSPGGLTFLEAETYVALHDLSATPSGATTVGLSTSWDSSASVPAAISSLQSRRT